MRILQIHNRYTQPGGEDVVVELEASALRGAGHVVETFELANEPGLAAIPSLAASPWNLRSADAVSTVVSEFEPDVAHVHNTWFRISPSILPVFRDHGIPVVATVHNYRQACLNGQLFRDGGICTRCVGRNPLPGVRLGCYRDSVVQSAVIAVSVTLGRRASFWEDSVRRYVVMTDFQKGLLVDFGIRHQDIVVKPHFVEDGGRRSRPPSDSRTVVFVGRLSIEKGISSLLAAWAEASPTSLRLIVIGDGPLRGELEAGAPSSVSFTGWLGREEVAEHLRAARAVMFPSVWYEPFGLVLIEAMAAGTPIVVSDLGGMPDVVGSARGDVVAPAGDHDAWAARIRGLDRGTIPVDEIGAANRAVYEDRYTVERGVAALENLYASVVSE